MKTTLGEIKKHVPCVSGWKTLCEGLGTTNPDTEVSLLQILDICGVRDAYWSLRCWDYAEYAPLLADIAESVLGFFETKYPDDKRPRNCIEAIRRYARGEITLEELLAAASAATDAANADAENKQWDLNEKLLRDFLGGKYG